MDTLVNLREMGRQYPLAFGVEQLGCIKSIFKFPEEIRKIIYTTNIIEGLHRQFRKVTKTKSVFPSDSSLEKMLTWPL